jgi:hypothetical protein
MPSIATRRLIDAAATLDPADRAFLSLWVNRGLDDDRLQTLTGVSAETLDRRRDRIVAQLSEHLGLPEEDVRAALNEITADDLDVVANGQHVAEPEAPATVTATAPSSPPPTADDTEPARSRSGSRRGMWLALLGAIVVIAIVVVVLASAGSSHTKRSADSASRSTSATTAATTPSTTTPTQTSSAPPPANKGPVPEPLGGLPGGLTRASGSVRLLGKPPHLKLELTVRGLPRPLNGHDEVWLYNSVLDSQPLARVRAGVHTLTVRLPRDAHRFRWIDISFQPHGTVDHSGESLLRATNPAHASRARLRRRSAHRRHTLHQASQVGARAGRKHRRHRAAHRKR